MKQSRLWLLALLSVLTLMAATTVMAEEGAGHVTGSWELGMSGISTEDNAARVNEYNAVRFDDGVALAPKLDLEFEKGVFLLELESETKGPRDQKHELSFDAGRIFKLESSLNVLQHTKDHETLDQMGATARDDIGGAQPNVTTDKIYADLIRATGNAGVTVGGASPVSSNPAFTGLTATQAADKLEAQYNQEVNNNYIVTRREWKNEAELVIPALPNVTFKAGARIETREGMEQAIGLSKCGGCHVSAQGKDIDERTEEFTLGATGKFGLLTVDYEYLNRNFDEDADAPSRWYIKPAGDGIGNASKPGLIKGSALLYKTTAAQYAKTPDSEKDSHFLKARLDLPNNSSVTASYVKADIESTKTDEPGVFVLDDKTLDSDYEGFNGKLATKFGPVRLSLRGGYYEIDGPEYAVTFDQRDDLTGVNIKDATGTIAPQTVPNHSMPNTEEFISAESRKVTEFGIDAVYRLAKATTLRLGYDYENIDRDEDNLGETETNTFKVALNTRLNKTLSGRISYQYQDIDEPLAGAEVGIGQLSGTDGGGGLMMLNTASFRNIDGNDGAWVYYWNSVYPNRELDSTNQPDEVHEAKLSTTWAPNAQMAATFFMRFKYEENNDVHYEQTTFVPGVSFWYAPSDKLNLTMSYTFNNQDTENRTCVGWYHG